MDGGLNLFAYADNSPNSRVDVYGLQAVSGTPTLQSIEGILIGTESPSSIGTRIGNAGRISSIISIILSIPGSTPGAAYPLEPSRELTEAQTLELVGNSEADFVNLDTGTLRLLSSGDAAAIQAVIAAIGNRQPLITTTALQEFATAVARKNDCGVYQRASALIATTILIPNMPSERVMARIPESRQIGLNDKLIFGTGDLLQIQTFTNDETFVRIAALNGVVFNPEPFIHPSITF